MSIPSITPPPQGPGPDTTTRRLARIAATIPVRVTVGGAVLLPIAVAALAGLHLGLLAAAAVAVVGLAVVPLANWAIVSRLVLGRPIRQVWTHTDLVEIDGLSHSLHVRQEVRTDTILMHFDLTAGRPGDPRALVLKGTLETPPATGSDPVLEPADVVAIVDAWIAGEAPVAPRLTAERENDHWRIAVPAFSVLRDAWLNLTMTVSPNPRRTPPAWLEARMTADAFRAAGLVALIALRKRLHSRS